MSLADDIEFLDKVNFLAVPRNHNTCLICNAKIWSDIFVFINNKTNHIFYSCLYCKTSHPILKFIW